MKIKPAERHAWILKYLKDRTDSAPYWVSITDAYFVDAYVHMAGCHFTIMPYGAHRCRQLGRDLTELHKQGKLSRTRTGLGDMHSMGFPSWVWNYRLAKLERPE